MFESPVAQSNTFILFYFTPVRFRRFKTLKYDKAIAYKEETTEELGSALFANFWRFRRLAFALLITAAVCTVIASMTALYLQKGMTLNPNRTTQRNFKVCSRSLQNCNRNGCPPVCPWDKVSKTLKRIEPRWTWICQDDRCERLIASEATSLQSLSTCNMLCGSIKLWPQPTGFVNLATTSVSIQAKSISLKVIASPSREVTEHLNDAFELMRDDVKSLEKSACSIRRRDSETPHDMSILISVNGTTDVRLRLHTDESYTLSVKPHGRTLIAEIIAQSFCGARHGLETLSQLIWFDSNANSLLVVEAISIEDAPRFHYRGVMLDTARNYFPVSQIIRTIDAMAACKLNTFHWHATDSDSFPLRLKSVPQLAQHGAFGTGAIYKPSDIQAIVQRAKLRGIRILIEVDAPAHVGWAWSWGQPAGLGQLVQCVEEEPWRDICGQPPCGQLNPHNPYVSELLEQIYSEIIDLTGVDDIFHIGGDEVSTHCWYKNIRDVKPMKLWYEFTQRAILALDAANGGKLPELILLWSSKLTRPPYLKKLNKKNIGIQIWSGSREGESRAIIKSGFRTILSHVDAWYLDCGFGSWRDNSSGHCGPYRTWQKVYEHRPWGLKKGRIEGGEVCLWSEQVGPEGLDARLWPRAAALAERMWSDVEAVGSDVTVRLDVQRERLLARGVHVLPLGSRWCSHNPLACD